MDPRDRRYATWLALLVFLGVILWTELDGKPNDITELGEFIGAVLVLLGYQWRRGRGGDGGDMT